MGEQNIPVPAETLRQLARGARIAADNERSAGRTHNAESLRESADLAEEVAEGKDGEFASIRGGALSSITAFGGFEGGAFEYHRGAEVFLKKYNYWD